MALLTALTTADNALDAAGIALRTVRHDIANTGNEDDGRRRVQMAAVPPSHAASVISGNDIEFARIDRMNLAESRVQDEKIRLQALDSEEIDVDLADAVLELQKQQNILQASRNITARILDPSLLSFLGRCARRLLEAHLPLPVTRGAYGERPATSRT